MTDQVSGYIVILERDMREDDAEAVLTSLRMTKGVIKVTEITDDVAVEIARARHDWKWRQAMWKLYEEGPGA